MGSGSLLHAHVIIPQTGVVAKAPVAGCSEI